MKGSINTDLWIEAKPNGRVFLKSSYFAADISRVKLKDLYDWVGK